MVKSAHGKKRRGERIGTFSRLGNATPSGIISLMPGVTAARGVFVPVPKKRKMKRKQKRRAQV